MRKRWIFGLAWLAVASVAVPPAPGWSAPERRVDIAATAARLDALHVRIAGHRGEWQATELINYHRVERGIAACIRATGRTYRPLPFVSHYDGFTDADLGFGAGSGSVFDSITDRGRRGILNELAAARADRAGVLAAWGDVRPPDSTTLNRCTAPYQHRPYTNVDPPDGAYRLSDFPGLLDLIARDPKVLAAMRPYRGCMKRRFGYIVDEDRTDFLYMPRISYEDAPIAGRPAKPAWTRGIKQIRAAFDADTACRLPAYRLAMRMLAPRIGPWERQHRAEIAVVRAAWHHRVVQARQLPRTIAEFDATDNRLPAMTPGN
jgi:hypothetical protein